MSATLQSGASGCRPLPVNGCRGIRIAAPGYVQARALAGGRLACRALGLFLCACIAPVVPGAEGQKDAAVSTSDRAGLLLELRLDGTVVDTSGNQRAASAHGALAFAAGRQGPCASFDGTCWIDTGLPQQDFGPEFTIECWVNPAPQQGEHADILGNHVSEGLGLVIQQDGRSTNDFYAAYGAGGGVWVLGEPVGLTPGSWQHVALVKARDELRFCLNGVPVAIQPDPRPAKPSPLPLRLGLGYSDEARCFRGLLADVRAWNRALGSFPHAGIDPAATREAMALRSDVTTPRPAAGRPSRTWVLASEDTRLELGVTPAGALVIASLRGTRQGQEWIAVPVEFGMLAGAEGPARLWVVRGVTMVRGTSTKDEDRTVTVHLACEQPAVEAISQWHAPAGPGPVQHRLTITNRSPQPLVIRGQPTLDLDLAGASTLWTVHSDGGTPDGTGVYRQPLAEMRAGHRYGVRTSPDGEFIPWAVLDADGRHGVYVGIEWGFSRIEAIPLGADRSPAVRLRAGLADRRLEVAPGQTVTLPPVFIGTYQGDLDTAGNHFRRWWSRNRLPAVLREDVSYPRVQWNAFGATGKAPGSWDPVEAKYYPLIDDIAPLGFEEVMIDVGWWEGAEPDPDPADWAAGMRRAAEYAHSKGLRFGLYWTDNLDMANPQTRAQRAARIQRLFSEYQADAWRSDNTRGVLIGSSFDATRGFYEMLAQLAREVPNFQWENCCSGGRVKDFGALQRCTKVFNSDTYSALHVRQAFHDSSYVLHPLQIEGHLGSTDGRFRPRGVAALRFAFRSMSMGAPEWFLDAPNGGNGSEPWTPEEREAVKASVDLYKSRIRPLVRSADLYHILPRPDGHRWDGVQYWDPVSVRGAVYLFKPEGDASSQAIRLCGLEPAMSYRLAFVDGSKPPATLTGAQLMGDGLAVALPAGEVSELVLIEGLLQGVP